MASVNGKKVNNAYMIDPKALIAAGIDPKTLLPVKYASGATCAIEDSVKKALRIVDEQEAITRFTWYNLPNDLDGDLIERILYYRGQAAFFYIPNSERFFFLPYCLDGTIDVYGRYTGITPLPFNGTANDGKIDKKNAWIPGLIRFPVREVLLEDEVKDLDKIGCVLLEDYCKQQSETVISRQMINDPILSVEAEAFAFARTAIIANSGVKAMRVNSEEESFQVSLTGEKVIRAAKNGHALVPIVGQMEFQDLTNSGSAMKSEEFLEYFQALDNFRKNLYGLKNGGIFQKKAHVLESEESMNESGTTGVMEDGLRRRKNFCHIVNSIWNLGIDVEVTQQAEEEATPTDTDGDYSNNNEGGEDDE